MSKLAAFIVFMVALSAHAATPDNYPDNYTYYVAQVLPTGELNSVQGGVASVDVTLVIRQQVFCYPLTGYASTSLSPINVIDPPLGILQHEKIEPQGSDSDQFSCPPAEQDTPLPVALSVPLIGDSGAIVMQVTLVDTAQLSEFVVLVKGQTVSVFNPGVITGP